MKKLLLFILILILYLPGLSQKATEAEAKEILKEKFVSCKEVGTIKIVPIPFTKEELILSQDYWLIPVDNDAGETNYQFIQVNSGNEYLGTVLSLEETIKILKIMNNAHRNFPDSQFFKFFKTNDQTDPVFDPDSKKTVVCVGDKTEYNLITLPASTNTVAIGKKSVFYILDDGSAINASPQKEDDGWVIKYKIISLTK